MVGSNEKTIKGISADGKTSLMINSKYWGDYSTSDLATINNTSILSGGDINVVTPEELNEVIDEVQENEKVTANALNILNERTTVLENIPIEYLINVTYSRLVEMRNNYELKPGQQYRITDYITTTSEQDTQSAGHKFDIIVTANSENGLCDIARAYYNEDDSYFVDNLAKLEAWQIWYSLDNDTNRFAWADSNGKGVIYRMIDEWDNDCPYDFKNIMFKRKVYNDHTGVLSVDSNDDDTYDDFCYTFSWMKSDGIILDGSVMLNNFDGYGIYNNIIKPYNHNALENNKNNKCFLNNNVFFNYEITDYFLGCYSNVFGYNCSSNTFNTSCYLNSFGDFCVSNYFGTGCYNNSFGDGCENNSFGDSCTFNVFKELCKYNIFDNGCSLNILNHSCEDNNLGQNCIGNSFGNLNFVNSLGEGCENNSLGDYCQGNILESSCYYNSFGDFCNENILYFACISNIFTFSCRENILYSHCYYNIFENDCYKNTLGEICYENNFNKFCTENILGNDCSRNIFEKNCHRNNLGYGCYMNNFNSYCEDNILGNECVSNIFENESYYNKLSNNCNYNVFKIASIDNELSNDCMFNTFGTYSNVNVLGQCCSHIEFGSGCEGNTVGEYGYSNTFGNMCYSITLGEVSKYNSFGNGCYSITLGEDSTYNSFGSGCYSITLGVNSKYNSFGNGCYSITLGVNSKYNSFGNGCSIRFTYGKSGLTSGVNNGIPYINNVHCGDCVINAQIHIDTTSVTINTSNTLKNIDISQGFNTSIILTQTHVGKNYTITISKNSSGTAKAFCLGDLAS